MKITNLNGFLFREHKEKDLNDDVVFTVVPFMDFVYGYETRNGQQVPALTVAIVPWENENDELFYGIGLSYCSKLDKPLKAKGRRIAEARARQAIDNGMGFHMKKYDGSEDIDEEGASFRRMCGLFTFWEEAPHEVKMMELSDGVWERVSRSFKFLARAVMPEIVEVA